MAGVRDFPFRPHEAEVESDDFMGWLDELGDRQNIDMQLPLTSVAAGDEVVIFDVSTGKTFKITVANLTALIATISAASQAEQEAGSSATVFTSPARQQFHPSAAKFWAFVTVATGTPTLAASYNVTSITDAGVGLLTITIATDFSSANWCPTVAVDDFGLSANQCCYTSIAAGSVNASNALIGVGGVDPTSWAVSGFGDQ